MPFIRPQILEGIEITDEQKRAMSKNQAKESMNNYNLSEDARKAWRAEYTKFVKEDVKNEQNIYSRMVEKISDKAKQVSAQAAQYLNDYLQR